MTDYAKIIEQFNRQLEETVAPIGKSQAEIRRALEPIYRCQQAIRDSINQSCSKVAEAYRKSLDEIFKELSLSLPRVPEFKIAPETISAINDFSAAFNSEKLTPPLSFVASEMEKQVILLNAELSENNSSTSSAESIPKEKKQILSDHAIAIICMIIAILTFIQGNLDHTNEDILQCVNSLTEKMDVISGHFPSSNDPEDCSAALSNPVLLESPSDTPPSDTEHLSDSVYCDTEADPQPN